MDKRYIFDTINGMLSKKHRSSLSLSEETRALICNCDSEQIYKILFSLYAAFRTDEEFVRQCIAGITKETKRVIGFGLQRD